MLKDYKKYNKIILSSLFSTLVFLAVFNWTIDAYDVFNFPKISHYNKLKPDIKKNQRVTKILSYKLDKKDYDSVFIGSSRVDCSISEDYYHEITGKRTKNFGMNALSHDETLKLTNFAVTIHPEIKTLYIGLDFFRFLEKNKDNKRSIPMSLDKNVTISELNPLILSFTTTISSFRTLSINIHQKNKHKDITSYFINKLNFYKGNYENATLADSEFEKIVNLKKELEQKGYKVVFYTNPTHALDIAIIDAMGCLPVFNEWKTKLAKNFEYTDFDFINELTAESVNEETKYFQESSHSTYLAGNLILDNLILHKNKLGLVTNESNVKKHILQNENALKAWKKDNPEWTKQIKDILKDEE